MAFDVRQFLEIDQTEPVELRICHIADLWYKEVKPGRMRNRLDTIYNLFPELVISEVAAIVDKSGHVADYSPEIDYTTNHITAYRVGGYLYQGASSDIFHIINCLYGSAKKPKLIGPANDIQKMISRELCSDISKLSSLREYYTRLLAGLSPAQTERFRTVFKAYIYAVVDDLGKFPNYRSPLFPFSSDRLVLELNNHLADEFNRGNYADFFLWLNLGALLRNEVSYLIYTYDSSFNIRK